MLAVDEPVASNDYKWIGGVDRFRRVQIHPAVLAELQNVCALSRCALAAAGVFH